MTVLDTNAHLQTEADRIFRRKRLVAFSVPALILAYLVYIFFAFNITDVIEKANGDNARALVTDTYSHKVHVTRDNRNGAVSVAIEGEKKGRYPEGTSPEWVTWATPRSLIWEKATSSPMALKPSLMTCRAMV